MRAMHTLSIRGRSASHNARANRSLRRYYSKLGNAAEHAGNSVQQKSGTVALLYECVAHF